MPTVTISITIPDGSTISIDQSTNGSQVPSTPPSEVVERYWNDYLSDNGRRLYKAGAELEHDRQGGVYSLNDIAERMGVEYETAQSIHRTSGRSARVWREETGLDPVIRLDGRDYDWDENEGGMRTHYQLPEGIAEQILNFEQ